MSFASPPSSSVRHSLLTRTPWRLAFASLLALPLLVGVGQADATPTVAPDTLRTTKGDLVTGDAAVFASTVQEAGTGGQVIVWLKESATPRPTAQTLAALPGSAPEVVALATEAPAAGHRRTLGTAPVSRAAADRVVRALDGVGALDVTRLEALPALTMRLPEHGRAAAVRLLTHLPNVDYVSAVHGHLATPNAAPLGSNPIDTKHTVHKITQAWDITRGSGAKIGVMDSGFARVASSGAFHDDGQYFGSNGIVPLGFVDDDCGSSAANNGNCVPYDDHGHGTAVTGVIGENDNNTGYVGIAPLATTYSMKIAWNTYIHGHCGDNIFGNTTYCIEDDDFIRAVNYAAYHDFDVLSMSFTSDLGGDAYRALVTARTYYGVLPLAATGNTVGGAPQKPASFDVVMGIAGVDAAGNNMYSTAARDVSGFTGPATLAATCYQEYYCDAGTPGRLGGVGGTSAATAVVAGIVGLIRSAHPNETPDQITERLVNTAEGPNKVVNAYAALTYPRPLSVTIAGPTSITAYNSGTWTAQVTGGTGPYSYVWYRDGYQVGTGASYSDDAVERSFTLQVNVTDALGASASDTHAVSVRADPCPYC